MGSLDTHRLCYAPAGNCIHTYTPSLRHMLPCYRYMWPLFSLDGASENSKDMGEMVCLCLGFFRNECWAPVSEPPSLFVDSLGGGGELKGSGKIRRRGRRKNFTKRRRARNGAHVVLLSFLPTAPFMAKKNMKKKHS